METQNKRAVNETVFSTTTEQPVERKRRINSTSLFRKRKDIVLVHGEEEYVLRITRKGKLILTK